MNIISKKNCFLYLPKPDPDRNPEKTGPPTSNLWKTQGPNDQANQSISQIEQMLNKKRHNFSWAVSLIELDSKTLEKKATDMKIGISPRF